MNSLAAFIVGVLNALFSAFIGTPISVSTTTPMDIQNPSAHADVQVPAQTSNEDQIPGEFAVENICPVFKAPIHKGSVDPTDQVPEWAVGDVKALQEFLVNRYKLNEKQFIDGIFGSNTETYLVKYQVEMGLKPTGITDAATQKTILEPCIRDAQIQGKTFSKSPITIKFGDPPVVTLKAYESVQEEDGTLEQGAFRIEMLSTDTVAKIRVTSRGLSGLVTGIATFKPGESKYTRGWPVGLYITLQKLDSAGATISVQEVSND
jgi:hypothetical protein